MAPCGVKIFWVVPENGGQSITKYIVEIKVKRKVGEKKWHAKELSADKFSNSVYVSSDLLVKSPFNL